MIAHHLLNTFTVTQNDKQLQDEATATYKSHIVASHTTYEYVFVLFTDNSSLLVTKVPEGKCVEAFESPQHLGYLCAKKPKLLSLIANLEKEMISRLEQKGKQ